MKHFVFGQPFYCYILLSEYALAWGYAIRRKLEHNAAVFRPLNGKLRSNRILRTFENHILYINVLFVVDHT